MPKPSELAAQSPATVASLRSVLGVDALEALVESAAGPTYASIALGEAATTTGQSFAVDNGDGTVSIYLRTGGGSTLQRTLATAAALAADGGASLVGFKQSGTGAVARTLGKRGQDMVRVTDFMTEAEIADAKGSPVLTHTAAIQSAINTGRHIDLCGLNLRAVGLTQSTNRQVITSTVGVANITKSGNGVILASTGNDVQVNNVQFNGDSAAPVYTGDNVTFTGQRCTMTNSGSQWAYGRAVKATGNRFRILGSCNTYATADATATGYDIEIGVAGTATLYHQIEGFVSSQTTGGILLIDTGSHSIRGGQFSKLTIKAGTSPAGVNGGMTANARIIGDVTVESSNAIFVGNQFSTQTISFANGTSGHRMDKSNVLAGATITIAGNASNTLVEASVGTGSVPYDGYNLRYGTSLSTARTRIRWTESAEPNNYWHFSGKITSPANCGFLTYLADGTTEANLASLNPSNGSVSLGNATSTTNFTSVIAGTGGVYLVPDGASAFQATSSQFRPVPDNTNALGNASQRFSVVYAGTGAINTSDARSKQDVRSIEDAERRVAAAIRSQLRAYRFKDAVAAKGDDARIHFGVIAQDVAAAFAAEGLDATRYALLCYDEWEASEAVIEEWPEERDEKGNIIKEAGSREITPAIKAGNRYGIRYDELMAFIIAAV